MDILLRAAKPEDRAAAERVEAGAMRGHRYLPYVWEGFVSDAQGGFILAEVQGEVVGCGKFTVLPDGSAWLEALRVLPEHQGKGVGKAFYREFFAIARRDGVSAMRMYTGEKNVVSKGLAERFGFHLAATYTSAQKEAGQTAGCLGEFRPVQGSTEATKLLMPLAERWSGFFVMNRTFYPVTPALCAAWAQEGKVFWDPTTQSAVSLGARFMADQSLHIAAFDGDGLKCLEFAQTLAAQRGIPNIECMYPPQASDVEASLSRAGFLPGETRFIVMETTVSAAQQI